MLVLVTIVNSTKIDCRNKNNCLEEVNSCELLCSNYFFGCNARMNFKFEIKSNSYNQAYEEVCSTKECQCHKFQNLLTFSYLSDNDKIKKESISIFEKDFYYKYLPLMIESCRKECYPTDLFYIAKSKINGNGIFAKKDIPPNTKILLSIDRSKKFYYGGLTGVTIYVNHCWNPNSEFIKEGQKYWIISNQWIKKDTEITFDYRNTPSYIRKPNKNWKC